jgi:hypothetical protein
MNESTEDLEERKYWLELEAAELRERGASALELEANRVAIIELQWELARRALAAA